MPPTCFFPHTHTCFILAQSLGISATTLKRLCRHYGIKRWPFRQISGIDRTVGRLQAELQASKGKPSSEEMLRPIAAHIHELHLHRQGMVEVGKRPTPMCRYWSPDTSVYY